jgi:hypothetical protein
MIFLISTQILHLIHHLKYNNQGYVFHPSHLNNNNNYFIILVSIFITKIVK